ncbi:Tetraspanin-11 [Trichoplax sp. H2]|nr:Tetraspanin-11 [Trichoplax sp. H2]|eukprot:RDD42825.1 Tetraspanin-11 [Trichoplax sp. H2]
MILFSISIIIAAAIILSQSDNIAAALPNNIRTVTVSAILVIVACVMMIFSGFSGCGGAFKRNSKPLYVYVVFAAIVLAMSIAGVVIAAINSPQISSAIGQGLTNVATNEYGDPNRQSITTAMDRLQRQFQCCGGNSHLEYTNSLWANTSATNATNSNPVPSSCCINQQSRCGQDRISNSVIYTNGCTTGSGLSAQFILNSVVGMGIAVCVIQGLAILCALILLHDLVYNEGKGTHSTTKVVIIKEQAS